MITRTERRYAESAETNARERDWWNKHAGLIAKVWEMHPEVSWRARAGYLKRAKRFFLEGRSSTTVLELGCGSGWVGQCIAGPDVRILGTDFSASQIELASSNAAARRLDAYCRYAVADSVKWSDDMSAVDSVLIHAFMHHLDGREIDELLDSLVARLAPGTRIWLYEPAYFRAAPGEAHAIAGVPRIALRGASRLVAALSGWYRKHALLDEQTIAQFQELQDEATAQGWTLSPKEVPFDIDEFSAQLAKRFKVGESGWATIYLIGWVFETNLLARERLRRIAAGTVVPILRYADEQVARAEDYLRTSLIAPNHAFRVWECEVR